jgi:hypothetical protein
MNTQIAVHALGHIDIEPGKPEAFRVTGRCFAKVHIGRGRYRFYIDTVYGTGPGTEVAAYTVINIHVQLGAGIFRQFIPLIGILQWLQTAKEMAYGNTHTGKDRFKCAPALFKTFSIVTRSVF